MSTDTTAVLQRILLRESYSLLQYMNEAWPWTAPAEQEVLDQLRKMIAWERKACRRIADWLIRRRVMPATGTFPEEFTAMHYVGIDHLLSRLAAHQQWAIQELEHDLERLTDADARPVVQQLLDSKRRHLDTLEQLAAKYAGAKAFSTLR
jgi:hypothetical protein